MFRGTLKRLNSVERKFRKLKRLLIDSVALAGTCFPPVTEESNAPKPSITCSDVNASDGLDLAAKEIKL